MLHGWANIKRTSVKEGLGSQKEAIDRLKIRIFGATTEKTDSTGNKYKEQLIGKRLQLSKNQ